MTHVSQTKQRIDANSRARTFVVVCKNEHAFNVIMTLQSQNDVACVVYRANYDETRARITRANDSLTKYYGTLSLRVSLTHDEKTIATYHALQSQIVACMHDIDALRTKTRDDVDDVLNACDDVIQRVKRTIA
jgi:hypothetical protein